MKILLGIILFIILAPLVCFFILPLFAFTVAMVIAVVAVFFKLLVSAAFLYVIYLGLKAIFR